MKKLDPPFFIVPVSEKERPYYTARFIIAKDIYYTNPSTNRSVILHEGTELRVDGSSWQENLTAYALYGDKRKDGRRVWECLGFNNPKADCLEDLIYGVINTLLFHATNYDGIEGSKMPANTAKKHYGFLGITYEEVSPE